MVDLDPPVLFVAYDEALVYADDTGDLVWNFVRVDEFHLVEALTVEDM